MKFLGYQYQSESVTPLPVELTSSLAVTQFIKDHYYAPKLIITDTSDNQLLLMIDGVDLYNTLSQYGISLAAIFEELRQDIAYEGNSPKEKPIWEVLYDQIGLSPGEIRMRQRVKNLCKSAETIADVVELIKGTYFEAHFVSEDDLKWCRHFNEEDYTATLMIKAEDDEWVDVPDPIYLSPAAKVKHLRSSEDIHTFLLFEL